MEENKQEKPKPTIVDMLISYLRHYSTIMGEACDLFDDIYYEAATKKDGRDFAKKGRVYNDNIKEIIEKITNEIRILNNTSIETPEQEQNLEYVPDEESHKG